mmetsp:Transcript_29764/g.40873  ORF Transcript_29764/g.40873 Transcript_29764/m.40873 type:complete len:96 (-) Transcript_29764:713-1000(-)
MEIVCEENFNKGLYSSQCIPRNDLDDNLFCSNPARTSCCSGNCNRNNICRPFFPPNCTSPTHFTTSSSSPTINARFQAQLSMKALRFFKAKIQIK